MSRFEELNKICEKIENSEKDGKLIKIGRAWYHDAYLLRSAYNLMSRFSNEFMQYEVALKKAEREGLDVYGLINEWNEKGRVGMGIGNIIHDYIETDLVEGSAVLKTDHEFGDLSPIIENYHYIKEKNLSKLKILRCELRITCPVMGLIGVIDLLAYDEVNDRVIILDWKTNEVLSHDTHEKGTFQTMNWPFQNYWDNKHNVYSIQLNAYKAALGYYGIKVDGMFLVHLTKNNREFIQCKNFMKELRQYYNVFKPIRRYSDTAIEIKQNESEYNNVNMSKILMRAEETQDPVDREVSNGLTHFS